jgi:hypothetical protein
VPGESDRDQSIERLLRRTMRGPAPSVADGCLDAETLAAWAERSLSREHAARVEDHLSNCTRCQAMVAVFTQIEPVQSGTVTWWRRPTLQWTLALGLGTVAAAILFWVELPRTSKSPAAAQTMARVEASHDAPVPSPTQQAELRARADSALAQQQKPADRSATAPRQTTPSSRPVTSPAPAREIDAIAPAAPGRAGPPAAPAAPPLPTRLQSFRAESAQAAPSPSVQRAPPPPAAPSPESANAAAVSAAKGESVLDQVAPLAPRVVVSEFAGTDQEPAARPVVVGGQPRGGAGGGAGRGAGVAESSPRALSASAGPVRWRILANGTIERSTSTGTSWEPIAIDPPVFVTGGDAPASTVCWLVGRGGVVLRSIDGLHFERLNIPDPFNLRSVRAVDAMHATVTTVDGRTFTTADGGLSWQSPVQDSPAFPF